MIDMKEKGKEWLRCVNLKPKHCLKPFKKICISLLFMVLGPWQTPGVTKGVISSMDLHVAMKSSI
jgi:hypothetical protein